MSDDIQFVMYGKIEAYRRMRTTKTGRSYPDPKGVDWAKKVRNAYLDAGGYQFKGPVKVGIVAYFGIPQATSKNKRRMLDEAGGWDGSACKKPDADNIAKAILDSLNNVAYKDDAQVSVLHVFKTWAFTERVLVRISPAPPDRIKGYVE
ncbi:MAG: RusA family crossover junction endodeoxyribonuclease [Epibacterium sp.]|nr:RusA family crossover junction endodeoxyribonuclease [Epibacterium sp.]NQX73702.1 RusA family crossover junction endodeoxyribonuclease [Epibacterium sp.]NQX73761.1 RusA family crossover junction endodeoxyribonuclease [Epibacterium sp.]